MLTGAIGIAMLSLAGALLATANLLAHRSTADEAVFAVFVAAKLVATLALLPVAALVLANARTIAASQGSPDRWLIRFDIQIAVIAVIASIASFVDHEWLTPANKSPPRRGSSSRSGSSRSLGRSCAVTAPTHRGTTMTTLIGPHSPPTAPSSSRSTAPRSPLPRSRGPRARGAIRSNHPHRHRRDLRLRIGSHPSRGSASARHGTGRPPHPRRGRYRHRRRSPSLRRRARRVPRLPVTHGRGTSAGHRHRLPPPVTSSPALDSRWSSSPRCRYGEPDDRTAIRPLGLDHLVACVDGTADSEFGLAGRRRVGAVALRMRLTLCHRR